MGKFAGFSPELFLFLAELQQNNDREWFEENRERYENVVRGPALDFITAMEQPIAKISTELRVEAKKVGGSLMRIHRDVRFSKDKSPFKTNVGIQFRHKTGCDVHAPGLYVHLDPDECFLGVGTWHPAGDSLKSIREHIAKHPKDWMKARDNKKFQAEYDLAGESLKRPPRGFDNEHPHIEDLKRKDFIAVKNIDLAKVTAKDFVKQTAASFQAAKPFMQFLCQALDVKF